MNSIQAISPNWFDGKRFTKDWTTNKLGLWLPILEPLREKPIKILEAGTFEGRSAVAFLEYMPRSKIRCIDIFADPEQEARFDYNVAPYGDRVVKHKGDAVGKLDWLRRKGRTFDFIYLDCAKDRAGAFIVSSIAWTLLKTGGLIIWDDLSWGRERDPAKRAEPGSRLFIKTFSECMDIIYDDPKGKWPGQAVARKISDWPSWDYHSR